MAEQPGPPSGAGGESTQQTSPVPGTVHTVAQHYEYLEYIGRGEFGEVYRALAPGGVEVAIRRLSRTAGPESVRRERQSLELLKTVRHAYLLQTQAYWAENDELYIVMELADGSLARWFKECKAQGLPGIPKPELLAYLAEAAEALDFLHENHIIHRDVKPANLLHLQGHAKVADFGLARLFAGDLEAATFCGTPRYMAPEVWLGQVSVHTDQYALALVYVDTSLDRPRPRLDMTALQQQHLDGAIDLEGFSAAEQAVLRRALALDPGARFPTCAAFIRELTQAAAAPEPAPSARGPHPRLPSGPRRGARRHPRVPVGPWERRVVILAWITGLGIALLLIALILRHWSLQ
jgi:serine/threonine protein kinase